MYIKLCDRCGRKTNNKPAFLIPTKTNNGSLQINGEWFGEPVILCNNCLIDFEDFLYDHESFNKHLTEEDNFEGKERCQIKF